VKTSPKALPPLAGGASEAAMTDVIDEGAYGPAGGGHAVGNADDEPAG
jgi:hypothetical protein